MDTIYIANKPSVEFRKLYCSREYDVCSTFFPHRENYLAVEIYLFIYLFIYTKQGSNTFTF
jgi:hypothetical protein